MKIKLLSLYLIVLSLLIPLVIGGQAMAFESGQILVLDNFDEEGAVAKKFRLVKNMSSSASGQFTAEELNNLFSSIPAAKKNVWIIDLRQESHGFINGEPITWYKIQNKGNVGKSSNQIAQEELRLVSGLGEQNSVQVYTLTKLGEGKFIGTNPIAITPHKVETEQQLVTNLGAKYQRFYVLDHHRPADQEVDSYVAFIKTKLQPEDWLHFHCRGGKGRSSTFMAMYDMIRNAHDTSFRVIMQRQAAMGNSKLDTLPTQTEKLWKTGSIKDRYDFLQKFYVYVADPNGYAVNSWSSWLKLQAPK